jgi:hypothetical protein
MGGQPKAAVGFTGPVLVVTGEVDAIFCGGNCTAAASVAMSIPAMAEMAFSNASPFVPYVQPKSGHAIDVHYNATGAYNVMNTFLKDQEF